MEEQSKQQQSSKQQINEELDITDEEILLQFYHVESLTQLIDILINPYKSQAYKKIKNQTMQQLGSVTLKASYQQKKQQLSSALKSFQTNNSNMPKKKGQPKEISKFLKGISRQAQILSTHTYDELITFFQGEKNNKQLCKKIISIKYKNMEVLHTHRSRKNIWLSLLNIEGKYQQYPNFYNTLLSLTENEDKYRDYFDRVIHADVIRTIHQNDEAHKQQIIKQMQRILFCFARRNPYIGYCQGMNFILNFVITMQFKEDQCFWILVCLLEEVIPFTYYTNMSGVATDIQIVQHMLKILEPKLTQKLALLEVDISIFVLQWLVCLYTSTLPFYLLVIVWDLLIIQGSTVLLKVAIVLFRYFKNVIEESADFSQFFMNFEAAKKKIQIDEESFLKMFQQIYIDSEIIQMVRKYVSHQKAIQKQQIRKTIKGSQSGFNDIFCNIDWPICFQQLTKQKLQDQDVDVWVFKDQAGPRLITDYLQLRQKKVFMNKTQDTRDPQKKIIIGRIPHICDLSSYEEKQYQNSRGIELDEFDRGSRRMNKNLQGVLNLNLSTTAQFFKRATMNKLAFMNNKPTMKRKS